MATLQARLVDLANVIGADVKALLGRAHSKSITLADPVSGDNVPLFFTNKPLTLIGLRAALPGAGASPSITYRVLHGSTLFAAPPSETFGNQSVTSTTAGNQVFGSTGIPAGSWVWLAVTAKGGTVPTLALTLEFL